MSNIVQGYVWNVEFPNPLAKMIALKLADNANDEGGDIFPATTTVAKKTGIARSSVTKWQYALEHSGLLKVVERSEGGSKSDTTRRAYDMDLLRRLARHDRRTDPELMLVEATIERQATDKQGQPRTNEDGSPKMVGVTVLKAVPYVAPGADPEDDPDDSSGDGGVPAIAGPVRETDASPVRDTDGSKPDPSATRTPAVRHTDGSRPPHGHEPFKGIPSGNSPPLAPHPSGGGRRPRATYLPSDWTLPGSDRAWAIQHAPQIAEQVDAEALVFRDWHAGKRHVDWSARWRVWIGKAVERAARQCGRRGGSADHAAPAGFGHVPRFSGVHNTDEPIAAYRERMIREGKLRATEAQP